MIPLAPVQVRAMRKANSFDSVPVQHRCTRDNDGSNFETSFSPYSMMVSSR